MDDQPDEPGHLLACWKGDLVRLHRAGIVREEPPVGDKCFACTDLYNRSCLGYEPILSLCRLRKDWLLDDVIAREDRVGFNDPERTRGLRKLLTLYRGEFAVPENIEHYAPGDYTEARRKYVKWRLGQDPPGLRGEW